MTALTMTSPPAGQQPEAGRGGGAMHIDLTGVPGLVAPAPPSNTLLITNLTNVAIFAPASLHAIRAHLEAEVGAAAIHAFAPIKSMRRIIVAFTSTDAALALRRALDGTELLGCRARLYFGEPTPLDARPTHLAAPAADKQFFISPPPSPPHGWTMRNEDPPNKEVHAADLASALAHLDTNHNLLWEQQQQEQEAEPEEDTEMLDAEEVEARRRQSTTVVFAPHTHGAAAGLPAVLVEDTTYAGAGPRLENGKKILEHTARPPVELME